MRLAANDIDENYIEDDVMMQYDDEVFYYMDSEVDKYDEETGEIIFKSNKSESVPDNVATVQTGVIITESSDPAPCENITVSSASKGEVTMTAQNPRRTQEWVDAIQVQLNGDCGNTDSDDRSDPTFDNPASSDGTFDTRNPASTVTTLAESTPADTSSLAEVLPAVVPSSVVPAAVPSSLVPAAAGIVPAAMPSTAGTPPEVIPPDVIQPIDVAPAGILPAGILPEREVTEGILLRTCMSKFPYVRWVVIMLREMDSNNNNATELQHNHQRLTIFWLKNPVIYCFLDFIH